MGDGDQARSEELLLRIASDEAMAWQCAEAAYAAEQDGNPDFANLLRTISRCHRINVLELGGQLAALHTEFWTR